ncbi:MAG: hypothetical protein FWD76_04880, partial [Firmicutes bacterium]|nr:hypothetical protein [Bacillota bacterium]
GDQSYTGAHGIYSDKLADFVLPTRASYNGTVAAQSGIWLWNDLTYDINGTPVKGNAAQNAFSANIVNDMITIADGQTTTIGDANMASTAPNTSANNVKGVQANNKLTATYYDFNADLMYVDRTATFEVEQLVPGTQSPAYLTAQTVTTWQTVMDSINQPSFLDGNEIDGMWNLIGDGILTGNGQDVQVDADGNYLFNDVQIGDNSGLGTDTPYKQAIIEYQPTNDTNYANARKSAVMLLASGDQIVTFITEDSKAEVNKALSGLVYDSRIAETTVFTKFRLAPGVDINGIDPNAEYPIGANYVLDTAASQQALSAGLSFNEQRGTLSGVMRNVGNYTLKFSAVVPGAESATSEPFSTTFKVDKADLNSLQLAAMENSKPKDGQIRATYGQKLGDIEAQLPGIDNGTGFTGFRFVDSNALVGDATIGVDEDGNDLADGYREVEVAYSLNDNFYNVANTTINIVVERAKAVAPSLPTFADVEFDSTKSISQVVTLPDHWYFVNPDAPAGAQVGDSQFQAYYNPDKANYRDSDTQILTVKLVAPKTSNAGMIIGIVAGVVALAAVGVVVVVLMKKKQATSTKAGSRGNRM